MCQNDASAAESCCIDDDVPHRQFDRLRLAIITFDVEAAGSRVDMSDPQPLPRIVSGMEACRKESARGFLAIKNCGKLCALKPHTPSLLPVPQQT